jgi:hypothetical protein
MVIVIDGAYKIVEETNRSNDGRNEIISLRPIWLPLFVLDVQATNYTQSMTIIYCYEVKGIIISSTSHQSSVSLGFRSGGSIGNSVDRLGFV